MRELSELVENRKDKIFTILQTLRAGRTYGLMTVNSNPPACNLDDFHVSVDTARYLIDLVEPGFSDSYVSYSAFRRDVATLLTRNDIFRYQVESCASISNTSREFINDQDDTCNSILICSGKLLMHVMEVRQAYDRFNYGLMGFCKRYSESRNILGSSIRLLESICLLLSEGKLYEVMGHAHEYRSNLKNYEQNGLQVNFEVSKDKNVSLYDGVNLLNEMCDIVHDKHVYTRNQYDK